MPSVTACSPPIFFSVRKTLPIKGQMCMAPLIHPSESFLMRKSVTWRHQLKDAKFFFVFVHENQPMKDMLFIFRGSCHNPCWDFILCHLPIRTIFAFHEGKNVAKRAYCVVHVCVKGPFCDGLVSPSPSTNFRCVASCCVGQSLLAVSARLN